MQSSTLSQSEFIVHYYLENESHSMDAITRNKCEAEALAIFHEVASLIGLSLQIETLAYEEGGLKEIWKILGTPQLALLVAVIALIFSRIPVSDPLQEELTKLTIEEKKLAIEKLKKELGKAELSQATVEAASAAISRHPKVIVRKSNFYKNLVEYTKVTGLGLSTKQNENNEIYIPRVDFIRYVMRSNLLPDLVVDEAIVEIVAPVLNEKNHKWKGIYKNESISFLMQDSDFKQSVASKSISFVRGSKIKCLLNIGQKLNEVGDVVITHYAVKLVYEKIDDENIAETRQGKNYRAKRRFNSNQTSLFDNQNTEQGTNGDE